MTVIGGEFPDVIDTTFYSDGELNTSLHELAELLSEHRSAMAYTVAAMRSAAAEVTHEQLGRWRSAAVKRWNAQREVAARHAVLSGSLPWSLRTLFAQMRNTWMGTVGGVLTPVLLFGSSVLDRGLTLPLFWFVSLLAEFTGRTICMRTAPVARAALMKQQAESPARLVAGVQEALHEARSDERWPEAWSATDRIELLQRDLADGEWALRRRGRIGGRLATFSGIFATAAIAISSSARTDALASHLAAWLVLVSSVTAVLGLAMWRTSLAYEDSVHRPPYPRTASAESLRRSLRYEHVLANVEATSFTSAQMIRDHSTEDMRRARVLAVALKELDRCERRMQRARARAERLLKARPFQGASELSKASPDDLAALLFPPDGQASKATTSKEVGRPDARVIAERAKG